MITAQQKLACAKRELGKRRGLYPRFVASGKLKADEAEREIEAMAAIVADYEAAVRFRTSQPHDVILFSESGAGRSPFGVYMRGAILCFSALELRNLKDEIDRLLQGHREAPGLPPPDML